MAYEGDKHISEESIKSDFYLNPQVRTKGTAKTLQRFRSLRDMLIRILNRRPDELADLKIADIGCGAGNQCLVWAQHGHRHIRGMDIDPGLVRLAKEDALAGGYGVDYCIGSGTALPWAAETMDVCLAVELLEHVPAWEACLKECARVLRPGGVLLVTTSNKLCPMQEEFRLPLYSWYPRKVKKYCEHLAVTTHPHLANYTHYPAVNWFSYYMLRDDMKRMGFDLCLDRFDVIDTEGKGSLTKLIVQGIRTVPAFRWLAQVASVGTLVVAFKANKGESKNQKVVLH
ncbi:MAG: class I SAM-dependent methyltransferase [Deltaproteobacteria bacterium]|nr:class I SAM-dependent methyltransferase [Deltaproteobacteria bacterium]